MPTGTSFPWTRPSITSSPISPRMPPEAPRPGAGEVSPIAVQATQKRLPSPAVSRKVPSSTSRP